MIFMYFFFSEGRHFLYECCSFFWGGGGFPLGSPVSKLPAFRNYLAHLRCLNIHFKVSEIATLYVWKWITKLPKVWRCDVW